MIRPLFVQDRTGFGWCGFVFFCKQNKENGGAMYVIRLRCVIFHDRVYCRL